MKTKRNALIEKILKQKLEKIIAGKSKKSAQVCHSNCNLNSCQSTPECGACTSCDKNCDADCSSVCQGKN